MLYLHFSDSNRTELRTEKKLVRLNTKFYFHNHVRKDGTSILYLRITQDGREIRHPLELYADRKAWNPKTQRLNGKSPEIAKINLVLDNISARLSDIRTDYYLRRKSLSAQRLLDEFKYNLPKVDFHAFFEKTMISEAESLNPSTIKRHKKVLNKTKLFKTNTLISDVNQKYIQNYISWCRKRGNMETTISGDLAVIKKYIRIAIRKGINTAIQSEEIKVKRVKGMRENLNFDEVRKLTDFYENIEMSEIRKHALGLFLFACWTGLRISDLKKLNSATVANDYLLIETEKSKKLVRIPINKPARKLANSIQWDLNYSEQKMRDELYIVRGLCGITKKVSFHVGRHTFATNFYRKTKDLLMLQQLLGHSNVRETMIYTHIVDMEDDDGIHKMGSDF